MKECESHAFGGVISDPDHCINCCVAREEKLQSKLDIATKALKDVISWCDNVGFHRNTCGVLSRKALSEIEK